MTTIITISEAQLQGYKLQLIGAGWYCAWFKDGKQASNSMASDVNEMEAITVLNNN